MSGDPIWYFFVIPAVLLTLQLIVLAIVLSYSAKLKTYWQALTFKEESQRLTLPTANENRAKLVEQRRQQVINTKEKLLSQGCQEPQALDFFTTENEHPIKII